MERAEPKFARGRRSQAGLGRREFEGHWSAARTSRRRFDIHRKEVWSVTAGVGQGGTCCHKVPGSKEGREDAPTADARHTSYRVSSRYILVSVRVTITSEIREGDSWPKVRRP